MTVDVTIPKQGMGMTEATLVSWLVEVGERVEQGQPIAEIETDKVEMQVEAPASGRITERLIEEGDDFAVPGVIARIKGGALFPSDR